jgi:outer membrane protein assembly factor BamB
VGNGSPWDQQLRSPGGGDNLFLASIVAVDAKTGVYKWHYQTTPGETWDYTATQPIMLADLTIDGVPRKVAMQAPKNGFFYVIDRTNGKLISAKPFLDLRPARDTPAGAPLAWAHAVDPITGRPLENPGARYKDGASVLVHPNPHGGHNWHPMSYSPETGLVYLPTQDMAIAFAHDSAFERREGFRNQGPIIGAFPDDPLARKAIRNSYVAALQAWDPVAQKEVWRARRRGPWNGGTLAVAGGLVFQGTVDGHFLAMEARTGRQLWSYDNQAATLAGPVSYEVGGEQYIAVPAGYGTAFFLIDGGFQAPSERASMNARVYAFKLGGSAPKPEIPIRRIPTPKPPTLATTADEYARGTRLYEGFCLTCHGLAAISGGVLPDLRKSGRLQDAALWKRAIVDGDLASLGMPRFGKYVSARDAELVRAYVARQAAMLYEEENAAAATR